MTAVLLYNSSNNVISENNITDNEYGIGLSGSDEHSSSNNTIFGNRIANNSETGISLYRSPGNIISQNTVTNNKIGIDTTDYPSSNTTICENYIANNTKGISLISSGNKIYHNNFIDNTQQAYLMLGAHSQDIWDDGYPSGGNYWSDYNGTDLYSGLYQNMTGSDSIGDTPYIIDENNQDRYPLGVFGAHLGDLNLDKTVDISDAILAASAFGSSPGHPNWNSLADLNQDNIIDIFDIIILANNFGKHQARAAISLPRLGASGTDMTYEIAQAMNTDITYGWLITQVTSGGPADNAGLRGGTSTIEIAGTMVTIGGDITVEIDGARIMNGDDLSTYLEKNTLPGQTIAVGLVRGNQPLTLSVQVQTQP
jgi:parallel beta-helix repeat protein